MIKKLTVIFFLCSNGSFAQYRSQPIPTQFDKFINQPNIEWAAYASDTTRFRKVNLNLLLLHKLDKKEIKASLPIIVGLNDQDIEYLNKKELDNIVLYPSCILHRYDSTGKALDFKIEPYKIDSGTSTLTQLTQILYIEKGELKSYIPIVTPITKNVTTSGGVDLGMTGYFTTSFNYSYNYQPGKQNKILSLGQTAKKIRLDL